MSTRPSARRARSPAITSASTAIVSSGPEGLLILPWRGKRACGVRGELNRRRVRVYHTTWTPQTAPTEPTGIVVLALAHQITRTPSMIGCAIDGASQRSSSATYAVSSGVSFRCRRGVNSGCRLTLASCCRTSLRAFAPSHDLCRPDQSVPLTDAIRSHHCLLVSCLGVSLRVRRLPLLSPFPPPHNVPVRTPDPPLTILTSPARSARPPNPITSPPHPSTAL